MLPEVDKERSLSGHATHNSARESTKGSRVVLLALRQNPGRNPEGRRRASSA